MGRTSEAKTPSREMAKDMNRQITEEEEIRPRNMRKKKSSSPGIRKYKQ